MQSEIDRDLITKVIEVNSKGLLPSAEKLSFAFDIQEEKISNKTDLFNYKIRFIITNNNLEPVKITFPNSPVTFLFTIFNEDGDEEYNYQHGVLASLSTYLLNPGESMITYSFDYKKSNKLSYKIKNTIFYYFYNNTNISRKDVDLIF